MRQILAIALAGLTLSGCVAPIGDTRTSSLNEATAPTYITTQSQGVTSRHCLKAKRAGFGALPPGCLVDTAFANQVAYPHDLISPHTPGASHPRTTALAASPYLQGGPSADGEEN